MMGPHGDFHGGFGGGPHGPMGGGPHGPMGGPHFHMHPHHHFFFFPFMGYGGGFYFFRIIAIIFGAMIGLAVLAFLFGGFFLF